MGTKSITITEDAYEDLASRKEENESFSDVIERIAGRKPLSDIPDVVSDETGETLADEIEAVREEADEEMEERSEKVAEAVEG
ncbi:MAG: antitoxin VapB family protein [Candidatus Nanohaloarchaea archaeon]|nr:antitoxin VapB family protein [Candidatus Nanohaloarchaea archaeon]